MTLFRRATGRLIEIRPATFATFSVEVTDTLHVIERETSKTPVGVAGKMILWYSSVKDIGSLHFSVWEFQGGYSSLPVC